MYVKEASFIPIKVEMQADFLDVFHAIHTFPMNQASKVDITTDY